MNVAEARQMGNRQVALVWSCERKAQIRPSSLCIDNSVSTKMLISLARIRNMPTEWAVIASLRLVFDPASRVTPTNPTERNYSKVA